MLTVRTSYEYEYTKYTRADAVMLGNDVRRITSFSFFTDRV